MFPPRRRSGAVLAETVLLISIVALSALIIGAMTGFTARVSSEYSEMGSEVEGLMNGVASGPSAPIFRFTSPVNGQSYPGGAVTITLADGTPNGAGTITFGGDLFGSFGITLDGSGGFNLPIVLFPGSFTLDATDGTSTAPTVAFTVP